MKEAQFSHALFSEIHHLSAHIVEPHMARIVTCNVGDIVAAPPSYSNKTYVAVSLWYGLETEQGGQYSYQPPQTIL